jgi:serine/threonine protein kinase
MADKNEKYPPALPSELQDPTGAKWLVADKLGRGGFAVVYRATNARHPGQVVALKAVKSEMASQIQDKVNAYYLLIDCS